MIGTVGFQGGKLYWGPYWGLVHLFEFNRCFVTNR